MGSRCGAGALGGCSAAGVRGVLGVWGAPGGVQGVRCPGGPRYLVAVGQPVQSLHQISRPLQQHLLGREGTGSGDTDTLGAVPWVRMGPHPHPGDMQAPRSATTMSPHQ